MAQIASIFSSTANSSPSSQVSNSPNSDSAEALFLSVLSQASNTANNSIGNNASSVSTSGGANAVGSDSFTSQLSTKITQLLNNGVSLDSVTKAIATKLVSLAGGKPGGDTTLKIHAVAQYLKQGESSKQDPATTAKNIVTKVKALITALQQNSSPDPTQTSIESGNILDASPAGDKPSTTASDTSNTNATAPAPGSLASALQALLSFSASHTVSQASAGATGTPSSTAANPTSSSNMLDQIAQSLGNQASSNTPGTSNTQSSAAIASANTQSSAAIASANTQSSAAIASGNTANANAASNAPNSGQQTLVQGSLDSSLSVNTDLNAIAAGQGTALERSLIRAANVDVARSVSNLTTQTDSTLASLSSSLEDLFGSGGSAASSDGKTSTGTQSGLLDTSLGDAALALVNVSTSSTTQTSFSSALASAQSPLNVDDIMDQVVQCLSVKNFTDNPTVNITLNPPNLGQLNVKISVTDSTVNATVLTQSSDVRSVLLDNRVHLDQVFASAGLKLGSLDVNVSGQGLQQEADRRQSQRESVFVASNTSNNLSSDTTNDTSIQTSGPSMLGSVDLSLLNQLV